MKKRLVSLLVAVVMISSVFSLSVVAEEIEYEAMLELMSLERASYHSTFEEYGLTGEFWSHADESYAYAAIICYERDTTARDMWLYTNAYVENEVDDLLRSDDDYTYASVDVTLGELQGANDYPMLFSYGEIFLGSLPFERIEYRS